MSIRNPNTHKHLLAQSRKAILSVASRAAQPQAIVGLTHTQRVARLEVLEAEVNALLELEREAGDLESEFTVDRATGEEESDEEDAF